MVTLRDIKKYVGYYLETAGFGAELPAGEPSSRSVQAAREVRGKMRGPAVLIQGIMPRSGTVYVGELLRLHPELYAYPYQLWEVPALQLSEKIIKLQEQFVELYLPNQDKLPQYDFMPLFGAALLRYLSEPVPSHQHLLLKMPSVQYLNYFFWMFPHEHLLILVRDGRDVVHSTLRTWPQLNFVQVCLRWNRSARTVLGMLRQMESAPHPGWWLAKYEDALQCPQAFVRNACKHYGLNEAIYPYEQIDEVRVIGSSKLKQEKGKLRWRHQRRPSEFRPLEYWRTWLPHRKLLFKLIAGRSLQALGYCENMNW